jgi:addiction module HigA family antidote
MKRKRCPSHPGAILRELYLKPLNISVAQFAKDTGISQKIIIEIINEKASVTSELAFRLSKAFPNSTFDSWIGLQREYDCWHQEL